jgi:hypothetical protein
MTTALAGVIPGLGNAQRTVTAGGKNMVREKTVKFADENVKNSE